MLPNNVNVAIKPSKLHAVFSPSLSGIWNYALYSKIRVNNFTQFSHFVSSCCFVMNKTVHYIPARSEQSEHMEFKLVHY